MKLQKKYYYLYPNIEIQICDCVSASYSYGTKNIDWRFTPTALIRDKFHVKNQCFVHLEDMKNYFNGKGIEVDDEFGNMVNFDEINGIHVKKNSVTFRKKISSLDITKSFRFQFDLETAASFNYAMSSALETEFIISKLQHENVLLNQKINNALNESAKIKSFHQPKVKIKRQVILQTD